MTVSAPWLIVLVRSTVVVHTVSSDHHLMASRCSALLLGLNSLGEQGLTALDTSDSDEQRLEPVWTEQQDRDDDGES